MSLIMWDKPSKVHTDDEQPICDAGIVGCYVPNMSNEDAARWKGKLVGKTTNSPQVELRKTFSKRCGNWGSSASVLIVVSLGDGYKYRDHLNRDNTKGINVHMAANGGVQMTFDEMNELCEVIEEAKQYLKSLL